MLRNIDLDDRYDEGDYLENKEQFYKYYATDDFVASDEFTASSLEISWLYQNDGDFDDVELRAIVFMPLILFEVEKNCLTELMEWDLRVIKADLDAGYLNNLPDVDLEELKKDINYCYSKLKKAD